MVVAGTGISSRWDRYLGMTAAMTQVPVPKRTRGQERCVFSLLYLPLIGR